MHSFTQPSIRVSIHRSVGSRGTQRLRFPSSRQKARAGPHISRLSDLLSPDLFFPSFLILSFLGPLFFFFFFLTGTAIFTQHPPGWGPLHYVSSSFVIITQCTLLEATVTLTILQLWLKLNKHTPKHTWSLMETFLHSYYIHLQIVRTLFYIVSVLLQHVNFPCGDLSLYLKDLKDKMATWKLVKMHQRVNCSIIFL